MHIDKVFVASGIQCLFAHVHYMFIVPYARLDLQIGYGKVGFR